MPRGGFERFVVFAHDDAYAWLAKIRGDAFARLRGKSPSATYEQSQCAKSCVRGSLWIIDDL